MSSTAQSPDGILVCFSHLRWNFVHQRPQHLIGRAAKVFETYFIEEPIVDEAASAPSERREQVAGVTVIAPVVPPGMAGDDVLAFQRSIVDDVMAGAHGAPVTFWYYTPMALAFSDHAEADVVVYDCMDELSAFRGAPPILVDLEKRLFARADVVFTGGRSIYEAKKSLHPNVHAFPSSIDQAHFGRARAKTGEEPRDQAGIAQPRIGFFGVIDERMDLGLVAALADERPDWQLVMIGPVVKIDPADLPRRPNIHWLGQKSYAELPDYLSGWQIGFMPFALNESTRFISPTKTPEFLAAGVPVVSTPVADVVEPYGRMGLVPIASGAKDTAAAIESAMSLERAPFFARVDAHLAGTSWDRTFGQMLALIRAAKTAGEASSPLSPPHQASSRAATSSEGTAHV